MRNQCITAVRTERRQHQLRLARSLVEFPKKFYGHIASISKSRAALSSLQGPSGLLTNNLDMAELLRTQYASVFGPVTLESENPPTLDAHLEEAEPDFSVPNVRAKLLNLKTEKSPDRTLYRRYC